MASSLPAEFRIYDAAALPLCGTAPTLELLLEHASLPLFHEAGIFISEENALYVTSNQYPHPKTTKSHIQLSRVALPAGSDGIKATCTELEIDGISMPNGGVNYKEGILMCVQGTLTEPGGLAYVPLPCLSSNTTASPIIITDTPISPSSKAQILLTSFHGRAFNSPNDVVVHSDGSIWFTDPIYGWEQGIRPRPRLPNQVYRFDPQTGGVRAMADGFGRPNGICFSQDEKTCYVTDTDWIHGDGTTDDTRASSIYAFEIAFYPSSQSPFLTSRRLFAMADVGIPDGIKCDIYGNVYSGCGDGVNIWSPGGVLLAKILIDGGIANFCFGREGELFLLNETRLWRAQIQKEFKGALLGL